MRIAKESLTPIFQVNLQYLLDIFVAVVDCRSSGCGPNAGCLLVGNSYQCQCNSGYSGNPNPNNGCTHKWAIHHFS